MEKGSSSSNARIRTYFEFDPIDLIDDIVCAESTYINDGIDSLGALMSSLEISPEKKRGIILKLTQKMQESLNINADIFEMYLMRNVFQIPVDIDLAAAIEEHQPAESSDIPQQSEPEAGIDAELSSLYQQIDESLEQREQLAREIEKTEREIQVAKALEERIPAIQKIIDNFHNLPVAQIDELYSSLEGLSSKAKQAPATGKPDSTLVFHQASFSFD